MPPKPRIIEKVEDIQRYRPRRLRELFKEVSLRGDKTEVLQSSLRGSIVIGIADVANGSAEFRSWRFKTVSDGLRGHYHEIWVDYGKGKYFLERSYFHLYQFDESKQSEREYILLHCDASEPDDTPHCIYKQSPHLHIEAADDPIPKAHFALYNGRVNRVLKSLRAFDYALAESIRMIESQILRVG